MKFEKYEKPDLEELELMLEGSFLEATTKGEVGVEGDNEPFDGEYD